MFGNNKKKEEMANPATKKSNGSPSNGFNNLVKGTKIEGNVTSDSDIRIDGIIVGTLKCSAKVIIGPSGLVEGEVICQNAMIEGRFDGNITVSELLTVKETAQITGEVKTDKLVVQSGATFNVSCTMGSKHSNASKGTASTPKTATAKGVKQPA